jgi:hypothetical protein
MSGARYVSILVRNDIDPNTKQLLNEEGLPIIEISEPMERAPEPASGASSGTDPIERAEDTSFVPMYQLPPVDRARNRAQMNRILDMLQEEERIESERQQARDREQRREELEELRANAKAGPERVKAAKEMQKKMGKALLKNMADAREREEKEKARQEREDLEREEARKSRKPRKSVSWAELPKQERSSARSPTHDAAGSDLPGRPPMRPYVVERFPARSGASSPPPPIPVGDSDDESDPPSPVPSDSDASGEIRSDSVPFPTPEHAQSDDGSEDEDEPVESHDGSEDGFDIDAMQHQREIALAYFERRNTIGADAARAMSAHSPDLDGGENEWEQEASHPRGFPAFYIPVIELTETPEQDVPLEAMLAGPRPKPSQSKFKSERLAQTYSDDTRLPSSTPPTFPATPAVLPSSIGGTLRSAVRMGRLERGQLVGNGDDGEEDGGDDTTNARNREFTEALYRGDVTNAGAAGNTNALIAALETAYGAPPKQPQHSHPSAQSPPTVVTASILASAVPPKTAPPVAQKSSKFKLARAVPPQTIDNDEGLREGGADMVEQRTGAPPVPGTSASQLPPMIVDSPSFAPPPPPGGSGGGGGGDAPSPMVTAIIDSPSFQKPQSPLSSARPMRRPPTVLPSVRESSGTQRQQDTSKHEPGQKASRFKAQRAEP